MDKGRELEVSKKPIVVAVKSVTVGRELNLNVTVTQEQRPVAVNLLAGVVTDVRRDDRVRQGTVLYRVAGMPVRSVRGPHPFYRALGAGDRGPDVRQLCRALRAKGLHSPTAATTNTRHRPRPLSAHGSAHWLWKRQVRSRLGSLWRSRAASRRSTSTERLPTPGESWLGVKGRLRRRRTPELRAGCGPRAG